MVAVEHVVVVVVVVVVLATLVAAKPCCCCCCCATVVEENTDGAENDVDAETGAEADDDTDKEQEAEDGWTSPLLETESTLNEVLHTETGSRCWCGWGCRCGCVVTAWCGSLTAGTWLNTAEATLGKVPLTDTAGPDALL